MHSKPPSLDWIHHLPHHFYRQKTDFKAPVNASLKIAETIDLVIRTSLSSVIVGVSIPAGYTGDRIVNDIKQSENDPVHVMSDSVFRAKQKQTTFHRATAKRPLTVSGGRFEKIWWDSADKDENHTANHQHNQKAVTHMWSHGDKPRPTIIVLHGFIAANWSINEFFLGMKFLYGLGCDIALFTLPHHGERQNPSSFMSGLDYVSGGIQSLNQAVIQSVCDVRVLIDYLTEECNVPSVGLSGLSLGGYTSALLAGLEDRLAFVMPIVPIISIPDAMMEWKPLDKKLQAIMDNFSLDMSQLRKTMAFHSPLSRKPLLDNGRLMIVAGMGDKMATPRHAETLQKHWGDCHLHWFKGSHALPLERAKTNEAKKAFLERIGFIETHLASTLNDAQ